MLKFLAPVVAGVALLASAGIASADHVEKDKEALANRPAMCVAADPDGFGHYYVSYAWDDVNSLDASIKKHYFERIAFLHSIGYSGVELDGANLLAFAEAMARFELGIVGC